MALERTVAKKPKNTSRTHDRRNIWLLIATLLVIIASVALFVPPQDKINLGLDKIGRAHV